MSQPLSRREVIAALLGTPVLLTGCGESAAKNPPLPPGKLVGASAKAGHRTRTHQPPEIADEDWEQVPVVIVGGGIAGLSAARQLSRLERSDYVLLELEPEAGGTSRSGTSPVVDYPWGAHYVPAPGKANAPLVELFREMGLVEGTDEAGEPVYVEEALCRDPEERIFYRGTWYEGRYLAAGASPEDQAQYDRFREEVDRWVAWRDDRGRRAFTIPMSVGSDDSTVTSLDQISMADWMATHGFDSPRLNWLVDYACRDDYGLRSQQTSAWAGLFYFAARTNSAGEESQPLLTWPEGNGRLVAHLRSQSKGEIRTGLTVVDLEPVEHDGRQQVRVKAVPADGGQSVGLIAERVIFAAPRFVGRHVIAPWRNSPPEGLEDFQYGAWVVANLFLRDRPAWRGFPLCWDNVIYESSSLGYVAATHQRGLDHGPTVFTWYLPLCDELPVEARQQLLDGGREIWAEAALAELSLAHPDVRSLVERIDVMLWGHAMILPRPGFLWGGARQQAAEPFRGIHFAHSDLSGLALFEEAFHHGLRAADEVAAALKTWN
ncbi:MAG: FAD-dependent oxidoreductase [Planctomycetaceae bacterium]|nr:FAD-dependent oxidoreductase [Planctomycetaceae bacterium]